MTEAAELVQTSADPDANIIFGAGIDETLGETMRITVIATGFVGAPEQQNPRQPSVSRQAQSCLLYTSRCV